ncbi:MAG: extracellular solute-binding protein [Streptosporangiaceae bacterium]
MDALQPGDPASVGGYRLLGRLGAGGMGQVFLGVSPGGRRVAVKLIHPGHAGDAQFRERFAREIEAAQRVGGFHTASVVDADPYADPPWMVTAYIEGPSLQEAVREGGPLPQDQVRALGAGLAEGLAAIHACGLVHRDLKPANVIMAADGPRIIDFGIARAVDATTGITATGMLIGTVAYMSPEQLRGDPAGPASDVFSLGGVLGFAATGRTPFGSDSTVSIMFRVVNEPPDLAAVDDEALREVIAACLAKSPGDRPSVQAVLAEFSGPDLASVEPPAPVTSAQAGSGMSTEPPSSSTPTQTGPGPSAHRPPATAPRARRPGRRRTAFIAAVSAVAVAAAIILVVSLTPHSTNSSTTGAGSTTTAGAGATSATTRAGGVSAAPGSATSGSITWSASAIAGTGATDVRNVLISAFEKQYPKIQVRLVSAPADPDTDRAALASGISGGASSPDVFTGDVIWPAQFGGNQLAVPMSAYLPASYWSAFAPGLVQGATYHGKIYGSPFFEDQGFLYYRKDLLAKEHMSVPTTWQQLESDAVKLVNAGLVKNGFVWEGASYEGLTCDFMEYLTDAGGTVTNSNYTKATLDSAAAVRAVSFMRSLIASGASPAAVTTFQEPEAMSNFAAGDAAFLRNWDYAYSVATNPATSKLTQAQVGVMPLPTFSGQSSPGYSNIGGSDLYVNPHSKNIAADLTFVKFMASPAVQDILAQQYGLIPTTTAVRDSPAVLAESPVLAMVPKTRLIARPSGTPDYPALSTGIYQNVNAALTGSISPSAAMSAAQSAGQAALSSGANGQ